MDHYWIHVEADVICWNFGDGMYVASAGASEPPIQGLAYWFIFLYEAFFGKQKHVKYVCYR